MKNMKPKPTPRPSPGMMAHAPSRFNFWFLKEALANFLKAMIIHWILTGHISDGNIWGIYWESPILKIGDFWAAMIIIWLVKNIYTSIRRTWPWL